MHQGDKTATNLQDLEYQTQLILMFILKVALNDSKTLSAVEGNERIDQSYLMQSQCRRMRKHLRLNVCLEPGCTAYSHSNYNTPRY